MLAFLLVLLTWDDLDSRLRGLAEGLGLSENAFLGWIEEVERDTRRRVHDGELEHLTYFLLQSRSFTAAAPVEPVRSARMFHETGRPSQEVRRRLAEFLAGEPRGARMTYFRKLTDAVPAAGRAALVETAYERSMRFLYEKEFASRSRYGQARRDFVASLYQTRGHSSDTNRDANLPVEAGIAHLAGLEPDRRIDRVLIVGPGLDFAPRTGFTEDAEPRSYQPAAVAAALVARKLATPDRLRITCADVNPRVVDHINAAAAPGISAEVWNVLTRPPQPADRYDLVIATNVLLYFNARELLLAVNNIHSLVAPGGYFLHNDLRGEMESYTAPLEFAPVHGQMIRLPSPGATELYEACVIHHRALPPKSK